MDPWTASETDKGSVFCGEQFIAYFANPNGYENAKACVVAYNAMRLLLEGEDMNASKENAAKALSMLALEMDDPAEFTFIKEFLEAAQHKLPSEASFAKDKVRKSDVQKAAEKGFNS